MFKRFIQNHFIFRPLSVSLLGYCQPLKFFQFSSTIEFVLDTMIAQAQLFFANDDFVKRFNKTTVCHRFNGHILKNDSQKAFDPWLMHDMVKQKNTFSCSGDLFFGLYDHCEQLSLWSLKVLWLMKQAFTIPSMQKALIDHSKCRESMVRLWPFTDYFIYIQAAHHLNKVKFWLTSIFFC